MSSADNPDASMEAWLAIGMRDCYRFVVLVASLASMAQSSIAVLLAFSEAWPRGVVRGDGPRIYLAPISAPGSEKLVNPGGTALDASRRLG